MARAADAPEWSAAVVLSQQLGGEKPRSTEGACHKFLGKFIIIFVRFGNDSFLCLVGYSWEYRDQRIWGYWDMGIWGSRDLGIWGSVDLRICGSEDLWIWGSVDLRIWGSEDLGIWGSGDLDIWRSLDLRVWGSEDLRIWGSKGLGIWGSGDLRIWRYGDLVSELSSGLQKVTYWTIIYILNNFANYLIFVHKSMRNWSK